MKQSLLPRSGSLVGFVFAIFILLGVVVYYSTRPTTVGLSEIPTQHSASTGDQQVDDLDDSTASVPVVVKPAEEPLRLSATLQEKIKSYKPGKETEYRNELEKNPHATPPVVLTSALELADIFRQVKSETEAEEAFQFFSTCVSKEGVVALQTSCLRYAKKLTQSYPTLRTQWSSLEAAASPQAKEILKLDSI